MYFNFLTVSIYYNFTQILGGELGKEEEEEEEGDVPSDPSESLGKIVKITVLEIW
jgi:hypothetical protein